VVDTFYINKTFFGTPTHFLCTKKTREEQEKNKSFLSFNLHKIEVLPTTTSIDTMVPKAVVVVGTKEFWIISQLYNLAIPRFPSKKYRRFFDNQQRQQHESRHEVPWNLVLPRRVYKEEIKRVLLRLQDELGKLDLSYYNNVFEKQTPLFRSLAPAKIDVEVFAKTLKEEEANKRDPGLNFKTFAPSSSLGYAMLPKYGRVGTQTGRLKILSGPRILTLKKDYRNIITSRFGKENGSVYELDYPSLEPRVLLAIGGKKDIPQDVYQHIIDEHGLSGEKAISRDIIKQIVISRIYGYSSRKIAKQLKNKIYSPQDLVDLIDDYFEIERLKRNMPLRAPEGDLRRFCNWYGRHIPSEGAASYVLLNYLVQSTAVDVALLGFNQINSRIRDANIDKFIVPIFVLHDALYLDIHNKFEYLLPKLCRAGSVSIPKFEHIDFYLRYQKK
jgi:hypothetical protein